MRRITNQLASVDRVNFKTTISGLAVPLLEISRDFPHRLCCCRVVQIAFPVALGGNFAIHERQRKSIRKRRIGVGPTVEGATKGQLFLALLRLLRKRKEYINLRHGSWSQLFFMHKLKKQLRRHSILGRSGVTFLSGAENFPP